MAPSLLWLLVSCPMGGLSSGPGPTLRERFGDYPFLTPRDVPTHVELVAGGSLDTRATTCTSCHPDNGHEWGQTTHAAAMRDLQFFAELAKPDQPVWLCLNCHAPTTPQRAERITLDTRLASAGSIAELVTEPNPEFDSARVAEGVTCATCHVRRDADGKGTVLGPRGSGRAPHRVREDKAALEGICVSCHSPGEVVITPTFPCWFQSAEELAVAPEAGSSCVSCHMPETSRPAATGAPEVLLRRHVWVGGGVPKTVEGFSTLIERGWESALDVAVTFDPLVVTLTNTRAGHLLPTGDPERFLRVEARLEGGDATRRQDVVRLGQVWDWGDAAAGRPARRLEDHRLVSGQPRRWTPSLPAGPATKLVVEVLSVRMTEQNAEYAAEATLSPGLRALWPEAQALLPSLPETYPLAAVVWRGTAELPGGTWPPVAGAPPLTLTAASPDTLIRDSAALSELSRADRAARLSVP